MYVWSTGAGEVVLPKSIKLIRRLLRMVCHCFLVCGRAREGRRRLPSVLKRILRYPETILIWARCLDALPLPPLPPRKRYKKKKGETIFVTLERRQTSATRLATSVWTPRDNIDTFLLKSYRKNSIGCVCMYGPRALARLCSRKASNLSDASSGWFATVF